jgi:hypothetical protein
MKTSITTLVCSAAILTSVNAWAQPSRTSRPTTTTTTRAPATATPSTPPATTTTTTRTSTTPTAPAAATTTTTTTVPPTTTEPSSTTTTTTTTDVEPPRMNRGLTSADSATLAGTAPPAENYPRFGRAVEHSVGARAWAFITPPWMVRLFAHVDEGWSGVLSISPGLEYVYRKGGLDVIAGLQYTSLGADPGYFHGSNEGAIATERVQSDLWVLYANVLFLWGTRFNDWFELQYGTGVGLGYVGGNLYRTQVYPSPTGPSGWAECSGQRTPDPSYCDAANTHYASYDSSGNVTSRYSEPRLSENNGNIPPVVPWLSLPHLALHFRPHRNVDIRLDGGFALLGFYGGMAAHYVF